MTNITIKYRGITYDCEGTWVPYVRGCYSGPPEKCYPTEGGYFEDFKATGPSDPTLKHSEPELVTDPALLEELNNEASAAYAEDCERDHYDWDEY